MKKVLTILLFSFISINICGNENTNEIDELLNNKWESIGVVNNQNKTSYKYVFEFFDNNEVELIREKKFVGENETITFKLKYMIYSTEEYVSFSNKEIWIYNDNPELAHYIIYFQNGWNLISPMAISTSWSKLKKISK